MKIIYKILIGLLVLCALILVTGMSFKIWHSSCLEILDKIITEAFCTIFTIILLIVILFLYKNIQQ